MNKDCIVVYASCGEGHKKAAEALSEYFKFLLCDILDFSPFYIKKIYSSGYRFIVRQMPYLWYGIFLLTENRIIKWFLNKINLVIFSSFYRFLKEKKPQCVILTHFFPISIVKQLKKYFDIKVIVVVTDIGVHPLWVDENVDYYLVPFEYTQKELFKKQIPLHKIKVAGFPLREGFKKTIDHNEIKERLGLKKDRTLLLLSSTTGNIPFLKEILEEFKDFNCIVIYGRDKKTKSLLKRVNNPLVKAFSYYPKMWELMDISSFIITKPGGLTVFEALYKKKCLIFTHFIKGQEEINKKIVEQLGCGFYANSFKKLREIIRNFEYKKINRSLDVTDKDIFSILEEIL